MNSLKPVRLNIVNQGGDFTPPDSLNIPYRARKPIIHDPPYRGELDPINKSRDKARKKLVDADVYQLFYWCRTVENNNRFLLQQGIKTTHLLFE